MFRAFLWVVAIGTMAACSSGANGSSSLSESNDSATPMGGGGSPVSPATPASDVSASDVSGDLAGNAASASGAGVGGSVASVGGNGAQSDRSPSDSVPATQGAVDGGAASTSMLNASVPATEGGAASTDTPGASETSTAGDAGATPAVPDPCEDFECPDLGRCSVQRSADGCVRVCDFSSTYEVALASQDDVDRLAALRCERVAGSLMIGGQFDEDAEIESVAGLNTIREVTGHLRFGWSNLTEIELPDLVSVAKKGPLYSGEIGLWLYEMPEIEHIRMPALETVAGEIVVIGNPQLNSIEMGSLKTVAGTINICETEPYALALLIDDNAELRTLNCLPSLDQATFYVTRCPLLSQCEISAIANRDVAACMACDSSDAGVGP